MLRYIGKRTKDAYKRDPKLTTQEWFETHIIINNSQVSPITGQFNVKYSPHLKTLMKLWDIPKNREFYAKWAAQSAKSFFIIGLTGKRLDTEPSNVLYMQPIKDDIPKIIDIKIDPLLRCMPRLWSKFEDYKVNESIRGKREIKRMAGGTLVVTGSGVKDRKSLTVPMMVFDEAAEFEEGTIAEAKDRVKTFTKFFPKIFGASTIVHPMDEICVAHDNCQAKLEWHFICPNCKDHFLPSSKTFKFMTITEYSKQVQIPEELISPTKYIEAVKSSVHVECPHCAYKINSQEKDRMLLNDEMDWYYLEGDESATSYGVSMNSLGSYFITFEALVEELIKASDNEAQLDKIYRSWFNEFYERPVETVTTDRMLLLGNALPELTIPKGAIKGYMCCDTQKDHLWVSVHVFTYGRVNHMIYASRVETFSEIEDLWLHCQNLGDGFMISKMGIDRRGYNEAGVNRTAEVDEFVAYMISKYKSGEENRIYATEGHSTLTGDRAIQIVNTRDLSNNRNKIDIKVIKMSNLYLKNVLARSIARSLEKVENTHCEYGSNLFYINQNEIERSEKDRTSKSYISQMTAETYDYARNPKTAKVDTEKSWVRVRKDNHWFDTAVISEAFAEMDKLALALAPSDDGISDALSGLFSIA